MKDLDLVFSENWVATSMENNGNWVFWHLLNVGITKRYVPAELLLKKFVFIDPGETRIVKNIDTIKLKEKVQFFTWMIEIFGCFKKFKLCSAFQEVLKWWCHFTQLWCHPQICIIQTANYSVDDPARHGQKEEKENFPTTELIIFPSKKTCNGKQK